MVVDEEKKINKEFKSSEVDKPDELVYAFLDIVDSWFGTHGLALSASTFVIAVKWFMDKKIIIHEANLNSPVKLPYWVLTMIKIALPTLTISQGY